MKMLSISTMGKDRGAYYARMPLENGLLAGGGITGRWLGCGAEALGLSGAPGPDALANLLAGRTPDGRPLVRNAGRKGRQPGWDLTFSAPKPVSVLWSLAAPEERALIERAHGRAVTEAVRHIEADLAFTRRGKGGTAREAAGLAVAAFAHGTSRSSDPHLHTHCLVLNLGSRADGSFGAIESRPLYAARHSAGAIYRAELGAQLRRLGLNVVPSRNGFGIEGVPEALCEALSARRKQIEAALRESGHGGARAASAAALETRGKKEHVPAGVLFGRWQAAASEHGFRPGWTRALIREDPAVPVPQPAAGREAVGAAAAGITARSSHFAARELVRAAAEEGLRRNLDAEAVLRSVRAYLASAEIARLGTVRGEERFATIAMLEAESGMLARAQRLSGAPVPGLPRPLVSDTIASHPELGAEQRSALLQLTTAAGRLHVLSGMAGTGKTHLLAVVRECYEKAGYEVTGAAFSARAARGMQDGAGIPSRTLHSLLYEWERYGAGEGAPKTVLVVDESSLVGTLQMGRLLRAAENAGVRLLLAGDARQLQPIEAGGPFSALAERLGRADLTEIVRQESQWARRAVSNLASGDAGLALAAYLERGLLTVAGSRGDAMRALVDDWRESGAESPRGELILAATNAEVAELNRMAQQARLDAGTLGDAAAVVGGTPFHEGDRILFTRNERLYNLENGSLGTVARIGTDGGKITVLLDTGAVVTVPASYGHVALGYALTVFKAQGMTADRCYALLGGSMEDREMAYVQASRARGDTRLYADAGTAGGLAELARRMAESHGKDLATDVLERDVRPLSMGRGF